ncbi:MAG TPA: hypothetical protein VGQ39_16135 [Pyrinomonadaceae bacterium]|jgi:hypothetical protein|nr:hypothetical protein [Pyrinomonadaceae bacterium]
MKNRFLLFVKPFSGVALRVVATASVALFLSSVVRLDHAIAQNICATIDTQLKALETAKARLQKNLQNAAGEEKQSLIQENQRGRGRDSSETSRPYEPQV